MKTKNSSKIFATVFIAVYGLYGIVSSIFQFSKGVRGLTDGFLTLVAGTIVCLIIYFSFFGKWGKFLRFAGRHSQADEMDEIYDKKIKNKNKKKSASALKEDKEAEARMREIRKKQYKEQKFKFHKSCIAPMLICLAGSAIFFTICGFELSKMYGGIYVKAQAEIINYVNNDGNSTLVFQIIVDGKKYITSGADSWAGVSFIAGNIVDVYHPAYHPEVIWQPSTAIMLCAGGVLFFGVGTIVFFTTNDLEQYVGIPTGIIFVGIPLTFQIAVAIAGGFNFFQLLVSGAFVYVSFGLMFLGLYFIAVGCINVVRRFTGEEML